MPGGLKPATPKPGGSKPATPTGAKDPNSKNTCDFSLDINLCTVPSAVMRMTTKF